MQKNQDLISIKCTQCDWSLELEPTRQEDMQETDCPAQPCPACGTEETLIEFLHEAEDWLSQLASHIHWPGSKR